MNTPVPYTAISLSVIGRLIFMFLTIAPIVCLCCFASSTFVLWIYYSVQPDDKQELYRNHIAVHFGCVYHPERRSSKCCRDKGTTNKGASSICKNEIDLQGS
jgi:hypothetical protein